MCIVAFWFSICMPSPAMAAPCFCPAATKEGYLPPWEVAKAFAFHTVLQDVAEVQGVQPHDLVGKRVDEYISEKVTLKGGGHPSSRAMRALLKKCESPDWFPGKGPTDVGGRPPVYSEHQKQEVARVAMDLKRKLVAPTPRLVRARLPQLARNPGTGKLMSNKFIRQVFVTRCFDETEDDPWQWLQSPAQDFLTEDMPPMRVRCAEHILRHTHAGSWYQHIAIDPCSSLLPKTARRLEEQQVAAMGKSKWMSPASKRKGVNLRAPATAKTQASSNVLQVHWTPIFTRGKIRLYVCDEAASEQDARLPKKLNDSQNLAKFVRHVLPGILSEMQREYGWHTMPRVVVHDKASYMVTIPNERLHVAFAGALQEAGLRSWVGDANASTAWLVGKLGDVYVHETAISHVRRLLESEFPSTKVHETVAQFKMRMSKVEAYMNSENFGRADHGLETLARRLRERCSEVVRRSGNRIPK